MPACLIMNTQPNQYELGRIAGIQEAQAGQIKAIEEKLDILLDHMNQTKGGFRILLAVGGAAATIGAGIGWLLQWFQPHG